MELMKNIVGPPVTGHNFFGREDEFEYVWELIEDGNNLVFPSPRRVGKTSFALKLLSKAKSEGWQVVSINLEKNTGEREFILTFIDELKQLSNWENVKDRCAKVLDTLKQFKPSFEHGDIKISLEWQHSKEDIYRQVADLLDHNQPTLIFMDELTVLLSNIIKQENGLTNTSAFLYWMRSLRKELERKDESKIRWIFCSSVGIENFTFTHLVSDTINDLHNYQLKSFDEQTSKDMLDKLGQDNQLVLTEIIKNQIVQRLSFCLPFFLQLMFEKIKYLTKVEKLSLDNNIVDIAYNVLIEEKHFNTWIERIEVQYGEMGQYANILLRHICQTKTGSRRKMLIATLSKTLNQQEQIEEKVSTLLYMLKNDGYLLEENGLYLFRSPLLRDFWFNRFVK